MNHSALSLVKLENNLAYDESLEEQPPPGAWEQPSLVFPDNFGQCTSSTTLGGQGLYQLPWNNSNMPCSEFKDFDDICWDFGMWPDVNKSFFEEEIIADAKPLNAAGEICDQLLIENVESFLGEVSDNNSMTLSLRSESLDSEDRLQSERYKSSALQLDEIQKYFDVPITNAAKELNVGWTVLKKRCSELNIKRWPHRKIKSLKSLIDNVKLGLTNEIEMLEEHRRMLHRLPEMELTERTKKLRQACFKANYKKRRALAAATFC